MGMSTSISQLCIDGQCQKVRYKFEQEATNRHLSLHQWLHDLGVCGYISPLGHPPNEYVPTDVLVNAATKVILFPC